MKNYLTTIFGGITALGLFLSHNANATIATIGHTASIIGSLLLGGGAKDAKNKQ